jgi:hypothetical protein
MFTQRNETVADWFEAGLNGQDLAMRDEPLHKTHDYIYHFAGCNGRGSICHLEIYEGRGRPPVILYTALPASAAPAKWAVECLAAEVVRKHFPQACEAIGEPFVWLERWWSEQGEAHVSYVWVTFDSYAPRCVQHARGVRHVALKRARRLVVDWAAVEELIGHALPAGLPGASTRSAGGWRNQPMGGGPVRRRTMWKWREE